MSRKTAAALLVLAAAAITAVWRIVPEVSPPVFDGQCLTDPYRLLGATPAPTSATRTYPAAADFPTSEVITGESPPQAQLLMTDGTFVSSHESLTVTIAPVAAPATRPATGTIEGNVYRFTATTASAAAIEPTAQHPLTIVLRATEPNPTPRVERLTSSGWTPLQTFNAGCGNTYEAVSATLGDFAMVVPSSSSGSGSGGVPAAAIIAALLVVLAVTVAGLVALNRRGSA